MKQRAQQQMLSQIDAGDEILTVGGIYGIVVEVEDDDDLVVEIADGIHVRIARRAVATVVKPDEDEARTRPRPMSPTTRSSRPMPGRPRRRSKGSSPSPTTRPPIEATAEAPFPTALTAQSRSGVGEVVNRDETVSISVRGAAQRL